MTRQHRWDEPGLKLHITNRGGAKRTLMEVRRDFRTFLAALACSVRRGEIQVLAYALMMNHFHLFVQSLGALSEAMQRIQTAYVRYFNRSRRRDSPLLRGRFFSKPVMTYAYEGNLLFYIHENPVGARLVARAEDWEWSSAYHFARDALPPWLTPDVWERHRGIWASKMRDKSASPERIELIERRLIMPAHGEDPLDTLLSDVPERVWSWMVRKAALADGTRPGMPAAGIKAVRRVLGEAAERQLSLVVHLEGSRAYPCGRLLEAALLRDVAGATYTEVGRLMGQSAATCKRLHQLHGRAIQEDEAYRRLAQELVMACVRPLRV